MKLNPNEKNAFEAIWQLVRLTNLKITATSLKNALLQHPNFPTFVAFSDVLHDFNVPNLATRLTPDRLHEIPLPAIAHFEGGGGTFITITKIIDDTIEWTHDEIGIKKESIAYFLHYWQGNTLLIEPHATSGEVNYKENRKQEIIECLRFPFIITGLAINFFGLLLYQVTKQYTITDNWQYYTLLFTKTIGLVVSVMLVWYSIDNNNSFLRSVCQLNNKTNCNNILNSKAARIFSWLTWSEVGLFYFAGGFLTLLFAPPLGAWWFLGILSVLALPYTLWSIYYQAFVAKEWCPLCVSIQVLIWAEFFIFPKMDLTLNSFNGFNWDSILVPFFGGWGLTPILWAFIKKHLKKSLQTDTIDREFQKLKFDPDYIQALMSKEVFLPPIFEGMKTIEMGNLTAKDNILLVVNPICTFCKEHFNDGLNLISSNLDIKITLIFFVPPFQNDASNIISQFILGLANNGRDIELLKYWFTQENPELNKFLKLEKFDAIEGEKQVNFHRRWVSLSESQVSPTIYLNNVKVPSHFKISDINRIIKLNQYNILSKSVLN